MDYLLSLLPAMVFLSGLILFDHFKLIKSKRLLICLGGGMGAALIAYGVNNFLFTVLATDFQTFSRYVSPFSEELLKSAVIMMLVFRKKIGFTIDGAIYGFATGTGFSLIENIVVLAGTYTDQTLVVSLLRGFGTAMMHGGTTALFTVILIGGVRQQWNMLFISLISWTTAVLIHSVFNQFLLNPFLQSLLVFTALPIIFALIFHFTNKAIHVWLEIDFSHEIHLLSMIKKGKLADTRAGEYLKSLQNHFSPHEILDIYCFLTLYLELSIIAKRNLILKESGLPIIKPDDLSIKMLEFKSLRSIIGKTGLLTLQPLLRFSIRELWKLHQFKAFL